MGERKYTLGGVPIIYITLVAVLGFFEYGKTVDGLLGGLLLAIVLTLLSLVGFMPIIGIILYWWLSGLVINWWSSFTGLSNASLTVSVAYWFTFIGVIILNIAITLLLILFLRD
jgi:hypothetical protein